MISVYVYGLGKGKKYLDNCLNKEVNIIAFIDNFKAKEIKIYQNIKVIGIDDIQEDYDYIIITLMKYTNVKMELINSGVPEEKIISYFSFNDADRDAYGEIIDIFKWRNELMWKHYREITVPSISNYNYEIYAKSMQERKEIPHIESAERAIELIKEKKLSLARFGDGEFELILGRKRAIFQSVNKELGVRLKRVLESNKENLLIAIADNYGDLSDYTDEAAIAIRQYLGNGTRQKHMEILDMDRTYYDAYLSRPYIMYRDKVRSKERFDSRKRIWEEKDILIVEGLHTRFGVGNDLLDNANTVQRIITLDKDCYNVYDSLIEKVEKYGKNKLILIALGPVATIMAYDLAEKNYWAIDIGQLDVEYEWYLRNVTERCNIPYKTVSEVAQYEKIETNYSAEYIIEYQKQIVDQVLE